MVLGIYLNRNWISEDPIHVHLFDDRGLETWDFVILIPTLIIATWTLVALWHHREKLRATIRQAPEKAVIVALAVGFVSGIVFGILFGTVFAPTVKSLIKLLHQLISP